MIGGEEAYGMRTSTDFPPTLYILTRLGVEL